MNVDPLPLPVELRVVATTLAALAIPGWALLSLRGAGRAYAPLQAWAVALSLGVAFYPVLFAVQGAVAPWLPLDRTALLVVLGVALLVAIVQLRRDLLAPLRFARLEQIALLVILATLATRLWVAHLQPFPAWSDSLHHVLLTELTTTRGRLPADMEPYFPIVLGRYHLGFYALTAAVQTLAGVPAHVAVTWVAQVLSGLCGLGVYLVLDRHVGRVWAVIGAISAGLISQQPAFYVNWGRFTQLAAQTILLPAWLLAWETLRRVTARAGGPSDASAHAPTAHDASVRDAITSDQIARDGATGGDAGSAATAAHACLLVAGVFLLHFRVAIFLALLLAATFVGEAWRVRREPRLLRLLGVALGVLVLAVGVLGGPRLLRAAVEYAQGYWAVLRFQGGLFATGDNRLAGDAEYFAVSWQSLGYLFADPVTAGVVVVLGMVALLRGNRLAWLIASWTVLLLALGEVHRLQIPILNVTNLGAVLILLYLPASLLVGAGLAELAGWLRAGAGAQTALLIAFLLLGAAAARGRVERIEPERFFVTAADLRAMRWIEDNTAPSAIVAVRTTFWLPNAPHGVDAGYWIPYLTKRRTTVGPMIANLSPRYANWATEMSRRVQAVAGDDAQLIGLWRRGVRYLYLGALGDPGEAVRLAASPHLALRYADGGVFIFEVDPSGGIEERAR